MVDWDSQSGAAASRGGTVPTIVPTNLTLRPSLVTADTRRR